MESKINLLHLTPPKGPAERWKACTHLNWISHNMENDKVLGEIRLIKLDCENASKRSKVQISSK